MPDSTAVNGRSAAGRWRRLVDLLTLFALIALPAACKRDAERPLAPSTLYPDARNEPLTATVAAPLDRLELVEAIETDDVMQATAVATGTIVAGTLTEGDVDWVHITRGAAAGELLRIELRESPACAELARFSDPYGAPVATARRWRQERPVLPSLRDTEAGLWVRITCPPKTSKAKAKGTDTAGDIGPWRLAVTARVARHDEEREPNDDLGPWTRLLSVGTSVQATFAPLGDVDTFRLDLSNALPGDAQLLSVTGVPGLAMELVLRRADGVAGGDGDDLLLKRTSAVGEGIMIPNLDVRRTGERPLLVLRAQSGAAVDHSYAATVRPLLPAGCRTQGSCPERIPIEREPNDVRVDAMGIRPGGVITGLLDASDDVDWYAIDGEPGDVLTLNVDPPEGVSVRVVINEGNEGWGELNSTLPGAAVHFGGRRIAGRRVHVSVSSVGGASRASPYTLSAKLQQDPIFEHEGIAKAARVLDAFGLQATGVLTPSGDIDGWAFIIAAGPGLGQRFALTCGGDGLPGLRCSVRGPDGEPLQETIVDGDETKAAEPQLLAPGRYEVVIDRVDSRPSVHAWKVALALVGDAVALPAAVTPVLPGPNVAPQERALVPAAALPTP